MKNPRGCYFCQRAHLTTAAYPCCCRCHDEEAARKDLDWKGARSEDAAAATAAKGFEARDK